MDDYNEQRAEVAKVALKVFQDYGRERALEMYSGAIDALIEASLALNPRGNGPPGICLAIDNSRPVELPCDVGPHAA